MHAFRHARPVYDAVAAFLAQLARVKKDEMAESEVPSPKVAREELRLYQLDSRRRLFAKKEGAAGADGEDVDSDANGPGGMGEEEDREDEQVRPSQAVKKRTCERAADGSLVPIRHPALVDPRTELERVGPTLLGMIAYLAGLDSDKLYEDGRPAKFLIVANALARLRSDRIHTNPFSRTAQMVLHSKFRLVPAAMDFLAALGVTSSARAADHNAEKMRRELADILVYIYSKYGIVIAFDNLDAILRSRDGKAKLLHYLVAAEWNNPDIVRIVDKYVERWRNLQSFSLEVVDHEMLTAPQSDRPTPRRPTLLLPAAATFTPVHATAAVQQAPPALHNQAVPAAFIRPAAPSVTPGTATAPPVTPIPPTTPAATPDPSAPATKATKKRLVRAAILKQLTVRGLQPLVDAAKRFAKHVRAQLPGAGASSAMTTSPADPALGQPTGSAASASAAQPPALSVVAPTAVRSPPQLPPTLSSSALPPGPARPPVLPAASSSLRPPVLPAAVPPPRPPVLPAAVPPQGPARPPQQPVPGATIGAGTTPPLAPAADEGKAAERTIAASDLAAAVDSTNEVGQAHMTNCVTAMLASAQSNVVDPQRFCPMLEDVRRYLGGAALAPHISTTEVMSVKCAFSGSKEDVAAYLADLEKLTNVGKLDGPPFLMVVCDGQLYKIAMVREAMRLEAGEKLHLVLLLGPEHLSWAFQSGFIQRYMGLFLHPILHALDFNAPSDAQRLLANKNHRFCEMILFGGQDAILRSLVTAFLESGSQHLLPSDRSRPLLPREMAYNQPITEEMRDFHRRFLLFAAECAQDDPTNAILVELALVEGAALFAQHFAIRNGLLDLYLASTTQLYPYLFGTAKTMYKEIGATSLLQMATMDPSVRELAAIALFGTSTGNPFHLQGRDGQHEQNISDVKGELKMRGAGASFREVDAVTLVTAQGRQRLIASFYNAVCTGADDRESSWTESEKRKIVRLEAAAITILNHFTSKNLFAQTGSKVIINKLGNGSPFPGGEALVKSYLNWMADGQRAAAVYIYARICGVDAKLPHALRMLITYAHALKAPSLRANPQHMPK